MKPVPFKVDGKVIGFAVVTQDAQGFEISVTTDDPRFKGVVGSIPSLPWTFDDGEQPSIKCPRCGMVSYHPEDIKQGYCGYCHDWTSPPTSPPPWTVP